MIVVTLFYRHTHKGYRNKVSFAYRYSLLGHERATVGRAKNKDRPIQKRTLEPMFELLE